MRNWVYQHDVTRLASNIGRDFTGYLEFTPQESEKARVTSFCEKCQGEYSLVIPATQKKEWFREEMKKAMVGAPANISPLFRHFWFTARCSNCGVDLVLMRS